MNIVIVILNTLRKDHWGCYDNSWIQTPNLDAFARKSLPVDGVDLSAILEGKQPPQRDHASTAFNNFLWVRHERYALICRNDGAEPKLYDLQVDPQQEENTADQHPEIVKRLFELALKDAGDEPLPTYDLR